MSKALRAPILLYLLGAGFSAGLIGSSRMAFPAVYALSIVFVMAALGSHLVLLAFVPALTFWVPLHQFGRLHFTLSDAVLVGAGFVALSHMAVGGKRLAGGRVWRAIVFTFLYTCTVALGSVASGGPVIEDLSITLKRSVEFSILIPICMLVVDRKQLRWIAISAMGSSIAVAVLALVGFANTGNRTGGPLFYANVLGLYAVIMWILSFSSLADRSNPAWLKMLAATSAVANVTTLAVSESRAATLGLVAAFLWFMTRKGLAARLKISAIILGVLILGAATSSPLGRGFIERWYEVVQNGSDTLQVASRLEAQRISLRVLADYPLTGVGISRLPEESLKYIDLRSRALSVDVVNNSGSQWVQALAESGPLGLLFLSLMLVQLYLVGEDAARLRNNEPLATTFADALRASVVAVIAAGTGMHTIIVPYISAVIWLEAGCSGALLANRARSQGM
jgi:hypothetical protein